MPAPIADSVRVTAAKETTFGTPVAASVALMGVSKFSPRKIVDGETYPMLNGFMGGDQMSAILRTGASAEMSAYMTYQHSLYLLESLLGDTTPSGVGPYVRAMNFPVLSVPTPRILTLYHYDTAQAAGLYRMSGAIAKEITIKGNMDGPVMMDCSLLGSNYDAATAPNSGTGLADTVVDLVTGPQGAVTIDAWGGSIGATAAPCTWYEYELKLTSKRDLDWRMGQLTPCDWVERGKWQASLKFTAVMNASAKAIKDAILAATTAIQGYQIRINHAIDANRIMRFDFAGVAVKSPDGFSERNGQIALEVELTGLNNPTLGNAFKLSSTNQVATLP